ncbi:MAG: hypothetical protein KF859_10415, partial [Phycisphaeraceae bacterium]|nr:hypothetical protein [Phycisphaeraceae bacterium]
FDLPRLWPGARLSGYVRNRTLHCDFGRWNQPDPNATGLVVQGAFGFHGTGLTATVQSFRLGVHFGDGPNVYEYLGGMAWNADDPTGLSMWISTQLMMSASWGYLSSSRSHISARSSTGSISLAGQAIGQIAGAMYASWAMGDGWGANNQALWRNVSESVGLAGSTFVGGLLGAMVGGSAANAIGAWGVGAAGSGMGAGAFTAASGNSVGRVVFDVGVAICSTSLDMIRGVASAYTLGVSIGAGFYGGVVSYLADSAHDWWKR